MDILLDTHILVWSLTEDSRLSSKAIDLLTDKNNRIFYSAVSIWESEIKFVSHSEDFPFSGKQLEEFAKISDMILLPLKSEHVFPLGTLKYSDKAPRPHKDPFDRILICQAKTESMKFLTHDTLIPFYNEDCVISV